MVTGTARYPSIMDRDTFRSGFFKEWERPTLKLWMGILPPAGPMHSNLLQTGFAFRITASPELLDTPGSTTFCFSVSSCYLQARVAEGGKGKEEKANSNQQMIYGQKSQKCESTMEF